MERDIAAFSGIRPFKFNIEEHWYDDDDDDDDKQNIDISVYKFQLETSYIIKNLPEVNAKL